MVTVVVVNSFFLHLRSGQFVGIFSYSSKDEYGNFRQLMLVSILLERTKTKAISAILSPEEYFKA